MKQITIGTTGQRLISLDFDVACKVKWDRGVIKHRRTSTEKFNGDLFEEAFMECLDLNNYLVDIERLRGVNTSIQRSMVRHMASWLQSSDKRGKTA